jgi:GxxExxY protein
MKDLRDDANNVDGLASRFRTAVAISSAASQPRTTAQEIQPPAIQTVDILSQALPDIVQSIVDALGSQQCESSYQRCLKLDLQHAGLTVEMEKPCFLTYKGHEVGQRRADLVVTTPSNEQAVLEIKTVESSLSSEHGTQVRFYQDCFKIKHGFLMNFPHDRGYPNTTATGSRFEASVLSGAFLSAEAFMSEKKPSRNGQEVEVARFTRRKKSKLLATPKGCNRVNSKESTRPWPPTTRAGEPCKLCTRLGFPRRCKYHPEYPSSLFA